MYFLQDVSEAEDRAAELIETCPVPRTRGTLWPMSKGTKEEGTDDPCKPKVCAITEGEGQHQAGGNFTKGG